MGRGRCEECAKGFMIGCTSRERAAYETFDAGKNMSTGPSDMPVTSATAYRTGIDATREGSTGEP